MRADDVTDDQLDAAIDFVRGSGSMDVTYSQVCLVAGQPTPQEFDHRGNGQMLTAFMERFHFRCIHRNLPPLDALVTQAAGRFKAKPGVGYFRVNQLADPFSEQATSENELIGVQFWQAQRAACHLPAIRTVNGGVRA